MLHIELRHLVAAIRETTPPTTVKELQRFLGMVGYYRRFIPKAASQLYHLFEALKGKPKMLTWTADCQLSGRPPVSSQAWSPTSSNHRRTNSAVGGVLEQRGPLGWKPLAFYSSKLKPNK